MGRKLAENVCALTILCLISTHMMLLQVDTQHRIRADEAVKGAYRFRAMGMAAIQNAYVSVETERSDWLFDLDV